jgi:hypothetical protein
MINLAWMAGLFEGEGNIQTESWRTKLRLKMTDKDVVDRFAEYAGCGSVKFVKREKPHYKDQWLWSVSKKADVRRLLSDMLPYLGNRRAYKTLNVLDTIELQ